MPTRNILDKLHPRGEGKRQRLKNKIISKEGRPLLSSTVKPRVTCLKQTTILSLDDDLLERIYEYLQLVDQVCLSLINKRLFDLFGAISKHPCLSFPKLLHLRNPILCVNSEDIPRNQLLLRLEDEKWAYCGDCLKLHPRGEFDQDTLEEPSLERRCRPDAGIVDLCPCIALTTRDRDKVINLLKSGSLPHKTKYGSFRLGPAGQPSLFHTCSTCFGPNGSIEIVMRLYLQSSGCLFVQSYYTISAPSYPRQTAGPIFACPHQDLMTLAHSGSRFSLCSECGTFTSKVSEAKETLVVQVRRPLDGYGYITESIRSKASWRNNCRLNRSRFVKNREYWPHSQHLQDGLDGLHSQWETKYCSAQKEMAAKLKVSMEREQPQQPRKSFGSSISEVSNSHLEVKLKTSLQSFAAGVFIALFHR